MKRLLVLAVLPIVLVPGVAHGSHGQDYAKGRVSFTALELDFSATSNFNGSNPSGRVRVTFSSLDPNQVITAEVRCLSVVGINATITAAITRSQGGTTGFNSFIVSVTDMGKFSGVPDEWSLTMSSAPASPVCAAAPGLIPTNDEIVIHDTL